jgi:hypothetical protein
MLNVEYLEIEPVKVPKPGVGEPVDTNDPSLWDVNIAYDPSKRAELQYAPTLPSELMVDPDGGPAQEPGVDYEVLEDAGKWYVSWDIVGSAIDGVSEFYPIKLRVAYEV